MTLIVLLCGLLLSHAVATGRQKEDGALWRKSLSINTVMGPWLTALSRFFVRFLSCIDMVIVLGYQKINASRRGRIEARTCRSGSKNLELSGKTVILHTTNFLLRFKKIALLQTFELEFEPSYGIPLQKNKLNVIA